MQPDVNNLGELFLRETFVPGRSSLLFAFFAQWLTGGHLHTGSVETDDAGQVGSNSRSRQLDMRQIYGSCPRTSRALRSSDGGRLLTEKIRHPESKLARECLPRLFDNGKVKSRFRDIPYVVENWHENFLNQAGEDKSARQSDKIRRNYFATGLAEGNSTIGNAALSTLFVLEHNRICGLIAEDVTRAESDKSPANLDERMFQTARQIVIALEIKIVIEEYINHVTSSNEERRIFLFDRSFAENQALHGENRFSDEFDLLYQWHCLMPDRFDIGHESPDFSSLQGDNELLIRFGFEEILQSASLQSAGKMILGNTPASALDVTLAAVARGRNLNLKSFNEYRVHFGLSEVNDFTELCGSTDMAAQLEALYGGAIDDLDFVVGLHAENMRNPANDSFGELVTRMIAYDAFTQALNNPLLSNNAWGSRTFTQTGMTIIEETRCLEDIIKRNATRNRSELVISMDAPSPDS